MLLILPRFRLKPGNQIPRPSSGGGGGGTSGQPIGLLLILTKAS